MARSSVIPALSSPVALLLTGLGTTVASTALFGKLTDRLFAPRTRIPDWGELRFARRPRPRLIGPLMGLCSAAGEPFVLYPVSLLAAGRWLAAGRANHAALLAFALVGSAGASKATKRIVQRPRPPFPFRKKDASGTSFPSQHLVMSLATYGMLAYLVGRERDEDAPRWPLRHRWLLVGLLCGAISISRVYQGVHRPTDVLGGWLAGMLWLGTCLLTAQTLSGNAPSAGRTD